MIKLETSKLATTFLGDQLGGQRVSQLIQFGWIKLVNLVWYIGSGKLGLVTIKISSIGPKPRSTVAGQSNQACGKPSTTSLVGKYLATSTVGNHLKHALQETFHNKQSEKHSTTSSRNYVGGNACLRQSLSDMEKFIYFHDSTSEFSIISANHPTKINN